MITRRSRLKAINTPLSQSAHGITFAAAVIFCQRLSDNYELCVDGNRWCFASKISMTREESEKPAPT